MGDPPTYPPMPDEPPGLWPSISDMRREPFEFRSDEDRLRAVWEDTWIEHAALRSFRETLQNFLDSWRRPQPWGDINRLGMGIVQGALIVSPAGGGATALVRSLVGDVRLRTNTGQLPLVRMPADCDLQFLYDAMLEQVAPGIDQTRIPGYDRTSRLKNVLRTMPPIAVAIDDCGHLSSLTEKKRGRVLQRLEWLVADCEVRLMLVIPPELVDEIMDSSPFWRDSSYSRAFRATHPGLEAYLPYEVPTFKVDAGYLDALDRWERALPLRRASHLTQREMALRLFELSDGRHGVLASVLRRAADVAIRAGAERITHATLTALGGRPMSSFRGFRF